MASLNLFLILNTCTKKHKIAIGLYFENEEKKDNVNNLANGTK